MAFAVCTAGDAAAIAGAVRHAILNVNRRLMMTDIKTQQRLIGESLYQEPVFGAADALRGFYASTGGQRAPRRDGPCHSAADRGVRTPHGPGSQQKSVLALVLRRGLIAVAVGMAAGLVAAWSASRWVHRCYSEWTRRSREHPVRVDASRGRRLRGGLHPGLARGAFSIPWLHCEPGEHQGRRP